MLCGIPGSSGWQSDSEPWHGYICLGPHSRLSKHFHQHSCAKDTHEFSGKQGRSVALVSFHPFQSHRRLSTSQSKSREASEQHNEINSTRTFLCYLPCYLRRCFLSQGNKHTFLYVSSNNFIYLKMFRPIIHLGFIFKFDLMRGSNFTFFPCGKLITSSSCNSSYHLWFEIFISYSKSLHIYTDLYLLHKLILLQYWVIIHSDTC